MEGTTIAVAKDIMGNDFIGTNELTVIADKFPLLIPAVIPEIPFTKDCLESKKGEFLLILGVSEMNDGQTLSLKSMRNYFGIDPDIFEPCFYNQDWYLKEPFMDDVLECKWYLVKKTVFEESRAILPSLLEQKYSFPSAILCAYTFFVYWFLHKENLWKYDFLWCNDMDHNGDRIYVGKYIDVDKVNKNGFSIHRHLSLRKVYAAITYY